MKPEGPTPDIRREIAEKRADRLKTLGNEEGFTIPDTRQVPLVPFSREKMLICEIKRRSPSKGMIDGIPRAGEQARLYRSKGAAQVSVLTEPDYFGGSLQDLMDVKSSCPDLAVLRKDFLLTVEDIDVSYRAGADACLLIASLLESSVLNTMHQRCADLGMTALVELHSRKDVEKVSVLKPGLVGINCRDLKTFRIYPLQPLKIRSLIDWNCRVIYESGILAVRDGEFALNAGFSGLLVGEGVVRHPDLIVELKEKMASPESRIEGDPWTRLCSRYIPGRPLVKICGITNRKDFDLAVTLGADLCGFILAPSPRLTNPDFIRTLPHVKSMKVGVVLLEEGESLPREIQDLLDDGYLDFIQYHGSESPSTVRNGCGYKALRIRNESDLKRMSNYYPLPCLMDAFSKGVAGGTGKLIDRTLVESARDRGELWLAGGLSPDNIGQILKDFAPELVDLSSGVEAEPGKKDPVKMKAFFKEINSYAPIQ
ncbi:bifunctional indole-3-glycerol phosphate synthase/phosphoribosylanthranilate isomerase [Oceanispirochaeta sp.]|jgi:indole-3-glycerol phosphate synthase/phosphoribosylanthranilate isomerase|uniref:bifunctional indole-3-glycerol phosphate synthase/phosphoribosylanthranilate isomerase n=1 Tax=Oceanispirochaeta sp. TaxID=2035350 RepID=UPI00261C8BBF|nr:bifunctional indole-3-glycerol phosphate synthase/phosphoribosylanthranilate isomerase [Oceanispirochaeta sp.]MDA3958496.1 bifunctional indole-3-glycerol phosphate synthase/phosphoribosylanthranilate isomerase [Oceanispirochaeta sp.]